jgi:glutamyl/glutaminyl-tRNA synthetase
MATVERACMTDGIQDPVRLDKQALRTMDVAQLQALLRPRLETLYARWEHAAGTAHDPASWYRLLVSAVQQEADSWDDLLTLSAFAFVPRVIRFTPEARKALAGTWVPDVFARCRANLTTEALVTPQAANAYFQVLRHERRDNAGLRGRQVMLPLHAALTGSLIGPCLGIVSSLLGLERCVQRLEDASR